ncbi:MAG: hypothetical protein IJ518_03675 [Clostridia bacterium]|nr:hypothetical protein [Clostridia bacterium]
MGRKQKKEKIVYIDDGRTLADMSGVKGSGLTPRPDDRPPIRFGDAWKTYWSAVKMMLPVTLVFVAGMALVYFLAWLVFKFA